MRRKTGEELEQDEIVIIQKQLSDIKVCMPFALIQKFKILFQEKDNSMKMDDFLKLMMDGLGYGEKHEKEATNKDCDDSDNILSQFSIESIE